MSLASKMERVRLGSRCSSSLAGEGAAAKGVARTTRRYRGRGAQALALRNRRLACQASASGSGLFEEDGTQEGSNALEMNASLLQTPTTGMAQLSGGGATMQKSKLNLQQEVRLSQPKTDDAGGGGDIGNRIFNGGGGGGDDSDDDEYQDDFGDDEEGDAGKVGLFDLREALPELFDRATMECILSEWYKTVVSLPAGLRMAVEMSVISSAQLVRFLSMDYRPQLTRSLTRALPTEPSRHFVGRVMGDPAFIYKLGFEQLLTITGSTLCELKIRGKERFKKEWKQVVANTAALCAGNAALVWMTAPSRAFGSTSKFQWQQKLAKLPNHVFEKSGPLRRYTVADRSQAFLLKSGQMGLVGCMSGALGVALSKLVGGGSGGEGATRQVTGALGEPSEAQQQQQQSLGSWRGPIVGMGLQMAVSSHIRYQGIAGVDRWLGQRASHLGMVIGGTSVVRCINAVVDSVTRTAIQGKQLFTWPGGKGGSAEKKRARRRQQRKKRTSSAFSPSAASTASVMKARVGGGF
uniref:Uncharacterized protein n=1 Tax=Chloropicon laureae TaxID=464258 RepID=A0A7S3E4V3_9CHLO|mmetsp:Transcript_8963/g.22953  ORF Transcript_8963/g.22953 Transcript_8963/m.22953 type:complete len:522 (+) Transcript_8963:281-1846(+)